MADDKKILIEWKQYNPQTLKEGNFLEKSTEKPNKKKSKKSSAKKRKNKRRRLSSSSSSSCSSSSSSSSDSEDVSSVEGRAPERFKVVPEEEKNKYELPKSLTEYVNEQFETYIPEKDLKSA
ncbi:uncharacterized G-patch domain protein DDB_G0278987-like [Clytia hemisphaerica]|uniref:uncharacterized G-patch domain protein DDB_G0278987-like n=1 Tax=Clytia hemisphaerica TaxID=252671 RepID=UPI0034D449BA